MSAGHLVSVKATQPKGRATFAQCPNQVPEMPPDDLPHVLASPDYGESPFNIGIGASERTDDVLVIVARKNIGCGNI